MKKKIVPHWMDCNCKCHGFHDNDAESCPHCHPEEWPEWEVKKEAILEVDTYQVPTVVKI